jgi:hypothetical protein
MICIISDITIASYKDIERITANNDYRLIRMTVDPWISNSVCGIAVESPYRKTWACLRFLSGSNYWKTRP